METHFVKPIISQVPVALTTLERPNSWLFIRSICNCQWPRQRIDEKTIKNDFLN